MKNWTNWSLIGLSCGAVAVAGAVGFGIDAQAVNAAGSTMQTGVTVTASTIAPAPAVESAVPSIEGPAPLPLEEQGLPG
jgi:hypothetical protein